MITAAIWDGIKTAVGDPIIGTIIIRECVTIVTGAPAITGTIRRTIAGIDTGHIINVATIGAGNLAQLS